MHTDRRPPRVAAVLMLAVMAAACESQDPAAPGTPGEGSISAVSPLSAFLDRSTPFLVSGSGTGWGDSATVTFGAGTTVMTSTASPSAISGVLAVDGAVAGTGAADVTVTDGGEIWTLEDAFRLEAPLAVDTVRGTVAQGSLVLVDVRMRDFDTPFATSSTGAILRTGFEGGTSFPNGNESARFATQLSAVIDLNAPTGPTALVLESGPEGSAVVSRTEPTFDVQPRTPESLAAGSSASGSFAELIESEIYAIAPGTTQVVTLSVTPEAAVLVSGPDSTYRSRVFAENPSFFGSGAETWFATVFSQSETPIDYTVTADTTTVVPVTYTGPVADFVDVGEHDVYAVDLLAGQQLVATVSASGGSTCTAFDLDAVLLLSGGLEFVYSESPLYCPTLEFEAPSAGTYFLMVGPWGGCSDCAFEYALTIEVT